MDWRTPMSHQESTAEQHSTRRSTWTTVQIIKATTNRKLGALMLVAVSCLCVRAQESEDVVKVDTSLVTVNVAVVDKKGRHLPGLQREDFLVTDEGAPVRPEFFDDHGPVSIVFVVDNSSSMRGEKWRNLRSGFKKFLATAREGNDYTLIAFNEKPRLVVSSTSAKELWQSLDSMKPYGETALYDGMLMGLNILKGLRQRHKALILLSDGEDNSSEADLTCISQEIFTHRAAVYM